MGRCSGKGRGAGIPGARTCKAKCVGSIGAMPRYAQNYGALRQIGVVVLWSGLLLGSVPLLINGLIQAPESNPLGSGYSSERRSDRR